MDGITGSGKTEVYFEAIAETLAQDPSAQVLVLLPEIALTQAVFERFEARFGAGPAPWHSGLSDQQRRRTWRETAYGRARIVTGARSALFLPFANLKLIIVDEEHDSSFKQEDGVRYHARDMAVMRAKLEEAAIVLASATPALETVVNAETGRYKRLKLSARPGAARLPDMHLVDLRANTPETGNWLSPVLSKALVTTHAEGEQSLLFLNRRGYAPLVICKACGERLKSPGTESWLTEHRYTNRLVCHLTGWSMPKPEHCPHCGAKDSLMGVGPGVERVAEEVRVLLPEAKVEIFSSDTAMGGDATRGIVERMAEGEIDVLVGINLLREGLDIPECGLVGILDADKEGFLRSETSLVQTIGRAARNADARVILYADKITGSMQRAMDETERRRDKQEAYNTEHGITPTTIKREVADILGELGEKPGGRTQLKGGKSRKRALAEETVSYEPGQGHNLRAVITDLEKQMREAAANLEFEDAARLRDEVKRLREEELGL